MKNCGKQEGADLYLWSGNPLYLVDRGGRWPLGWQEMMLKLQGHACTLPMVVLSSSSCHLAPLSWVWIPCIIGLQMDVGNNQYWFNSNVLKYCFEKGTGDPGGWARWDNSVSSLPSTQKNLSGLHRAALTQSSCTNTQLREPRWMQQGRVVCCFHQLQENDDICTS